MPPTPILIDYATSPISQKVHSLCAATGTALKSWDQSSLLPRPALENLGITYRRIPLLVIGKDIFCDSSLIIDTLQQNYDRLPTSPADKAYEDFGSSTCWLALRIIPQAAWTPEFIKDRQTIFHVVLRPDWSTLRPSALAEFRAALDIIEREFLGNSKPWINGDHQSLADIHVGFGVRWILHDISVKSEPGFGQEDFPNIYTWLEKFPTRKRDILLQEEAMELITKSESFVSRTSPGAVDPQNDLQGEMVTIESVDTTPGAHPQLGKLLSLNFNRVTIELQNGLRLHFPRRGYIVRKHEG